MAILTARKAVKCIELSDVTIGHSYPEGKKKGERKERGIGGRSKGKVGKGGE